MSAEIRALTSARRAISSYRHALWPAARTAREVSYGRIATRESKATKLSRSPVIGE